MNTSNMVGISVPYILTVDSSMSERKHNDENRVEKQLINAIEKANHDKNSR